MKSRLKTLALLASLLSCSLNTLQAEVVPAFIRLRDTTAGNEREYMVPAGKIFIMEYVTVDIPALNATPDDILLRLYRIRSNFSSSSLIVNIYKIVGKYESDELVKLNPPLRLSAGEKIRTPSSTGTSGEVYFLQGLLIDESDLYANVDVELKNTRVAGGKLMADASLASPRPVVTKVEASTDLQSFETDPSAAVTQTSDPSQATVSVDADRTDKFIKVTAVARRK